MNPIKSPKKLAKAVTLKVIIGSQSGPRLTGIIASFGLDNAKTGADPSDIVEAGTFILSICSPTPSISFE